MSILAISPLGERSAIRQIGSVSGCRSTRQGCPVPRMYIISIILPVHLYVLWAVLRASHCAGFRSLYFLTQKIARRFTRLVVLFLTNCHWHNCQYWQFPIFIFFCKFTFTHLSNSQYPWLFKCLTIRRNATVLQTVVTVYQSFCLPSAFYLSSHKHG